jgi:predicted alpha/beta hydrolase
MSFFVNAPQETRIVDPASIGAKRIGHLGFFRRDFGETLWREATDWLEGEAGLRG